MGGRARGVSRSHGRTKKPKPFGSKLSLEQIMRKINYLNSLKGRRKLTPEGANLLAKLRKLAGQ